MAYNNSKFPWLTESQVNALEEKTASLTWDEKRQVQAKLYQMVINMKKQEEYNDDRLWTNNELWFRSLDMKDKKQQNCMQSWCRMELAADKSKSFFWLNAMTDTKTAIGWMLDYAQDKWVNLELFNKYLNDWDETFFIDAWIQKEENQFEKAEQNKSNVWWNIAMWVWATVWTAIGLAWTSPVWKLADLAYWSTISSNKKDKDIQYTREVAPKEIEEYKKQIAEREQLLKDIDNDPKYSKSMKESASEYIKKEINSLNESIRKAEFRLDKANAPTTAETAYEYGIKWVTTDDIWKKAELEANKLWNGWVQLKLDSSKERLNLRELLDEVDVSKLAKENGEIPKLEEALEMFKEAYKDPKYTNMNMADANNFKSNLYDKVPASAWDGKEIQNAYKKVINEISSLVRTDTQEKLSAEFWEDIAKQYIDWANLHNIAEWNKMEWLGKSKIFKSWVFSKAAAAVDTALTPVLSEWWYALKKANEAIKWAWKKVVEWIKNLVSTAKENPVEAAKSWVKWAKWLLRENALFAVWEQLTEWAKEAIDKWYLWKSTVLNANKATKEEATEWLKDEWFVQYLRDTWMNPDKIIKDMWLDEKEINKALDTQKKLETKSKQAKIQGSTVEWKLKKELEKSDKTNPLLKKTTALKNQNAKVTTKKKSGK